MTNQESAIFSKVLDTNWEVKELTEAGDWDKARAKVKEHQAHVEELKQLMGEKAYNDFINTGRKMFAPREEEEEA